MTLQLERLPCSGIFPMGCSPSKISLAFAGSRSHPGSLASGSTRNVESSLTMSSSPQTQKQRAGLPLSPRLPAHNRKTSSGTSTMIPEPHDLGARRNSRTDLGSTMGSRTARSTLFPSHDLHQSTIFTGGYSITTSDADVSTFRSRLRRY